MKDLKSSWGVEVLDLMRKLLKNTKPRLLNYKELKRRLRKIYRKRCRSRCKEGTQ